MEVNAQTLALILLGLRFIAVGLIVSVLIRQIINIRTLTTDYPAVRFTVLVLTIVLLAGQLIPIFLDSLVVFGSGYAGRSSTPNLLGASYAFNNALKDVIIGSLLAFLYFRPNISKRWR